MEIQAHFWMPGKGLDARYTLFHLILKTILENSYICPHFVDKKTEAGRDE